MVPVEALKTFQTLVDFGAEIFAAAIGYVGREGICCQDGFVRIRYASVGGVEYGAPVFVAAGPPPARRVLALSASPNPTAGPLVLTLAVQAAGVVAIEVFDALGRRVYREQVARPAGSHVLMLDASGWAPGLYVVRATAGGRAATVRVARH